MSVHREFRALCADYCGGRHRRTVIPRYDYRCANGHDQIDVTARPGDRPPCPACGAATEVIWQTSFPNIIRDEYPGGLTIHNMTATPETFYSKSEHKRRMKELGLVNRVEHKEWNHTDKSPHTTKWF